MKYIERPAAGQITDLGSMALQDADAVDISGGDIYNVRFGYYGVMWNESADAYTRTGSTALGENGRTFPDTVLPIQAAMKRCVMNDAGVVQYYLDPDDSTKKADGSAASLDGSDGQVMVEIPAFYYRYNYIEPNHTWEISQTPLDGFTLHPAFVKNGTAVAHRYVGAYEGSLYDDSAGAMVAAADVSSSLYAAGDKLCSVSGVYPKTNETRAEFRAAASARGAGWHQLDADLVHAIQLLYLIEYADFYSQLMIGNGRVNLSAGDWVASEIYDGTNYGYIGMCGLSNADGNGTNANNDATDLTTGESPAYMSYRGIENFWGNVWKFVDGINIHNSSANGSRAYIAGDHTDFADDTDTGYELVTSDLVQSDGYVSALCPIDQAFLPKSVSGGSSSTFLTDYYYTYYDNDPDSGWRVARLGGRADNGTHAGAFYWASYDGSSGAGTKFGGRLCY